MRKVNDMIARQRIALVFTNQLRDKLGASFGDLYTSSGGRALPFHASVRVRLKGIGQIKAGDDTVGIKCRALVIKNRMGPPLRTADYDMFFSSGIDDYGGWLTVLKNHEMVSQSGAWYTITDHNGEDRKFQAKNWISMLEDDDEFREYIYDKIADTVIMKYRTIDKLELDDLDIETMKEGEEFEQSLSKSKFQSKGHLELLTKIQQLGYEVFSEYFICSRPYDIFVKELNLVIEFNGTFWHRDPRFYTLTEDVQRIYDRDLCKKDLALKNNFNFKTVWQHDWETLNKDEIIRKLLNE